MATNKALVKALLHISRTDLAEKAVALQKSLRDTVHSPPSPSETSLATPTSPASSSGIEDMSPPAIVSPTLPNSPSEHRAQEVISNLRQLEEEFYDLVMYIEVTLEKSELCLRTITRRLRMLPQSVQRQHQTDENYITVRQRILDSETVKNYLTI